METITSILSSSWAVILTILGFSFIIFVHELGHFIMAKRAGVKVDKFFIGFDFGGLKVFSIIRNETEYGIGIFPFGGYVKLHGYEELPGHETEIKDLPKAHFHAKTIGERFGIMVGGVAMNFISAVFLILIIYGIGKEFAAPIIGQVGLTAMQAGLKPDDKVIAINGEPIKTFNDIQKKVVLSKQGETLAFKIERNKEVLEVNLKPQMNYEQGVPEIGIYPQRGLTIDSIYDGSPAAKAGLLPGDKVTKINDEVISKYYQFDEIIEKNISKEIKLGVIRDDKSIELKMTPSKQPSYFLKFASGFKNHKLVEIETVLPGSAAEKAGLKEWDKIVRINGQNIYGVEDMASLLSESKDKELEVEIIRNGANLKIQVIPVFNQIENRYMLGINSSQENDLCVISKIEINGPAYMAGIREKDRIKSLNGVPVNSISQLARITKQNFGNTVEIVFERMDKGELKDNDSKITLRTPNRVGFFTKIYHKTQTLFSGNQYILDKNGLGVIFNKDIFLASPSVDSQAFKAGFKEGDRFLAVNYLVLGEEKDNTYTKETLPLGWNGIDSIFSNIASRMSIKKGKVVDTQIVPEKLIVNIKYERDGKQMETTITPTELPVNQKGFSGVNFGVESTLYRYSSVGEATTLVYDETLNMLDFTVSAFSRLITGHVGSDSLSGPVGIIPFIYHIAKSGFVDLLWIIAMLSVNIGFMNFLPFPPLDGGAIFFLLIEKLKGSPVSAKFQMGIQNAGVLFLVGLMLFVTMNDISKLVS